MIDLDAVEDMEGLLNAYSKKHILYIVLAEQLALDKITYREFQKFSQWFGIYYYVLPANRECLPELSDWLYAKRRYNLFGLALTASHLASNLTQEQQYLLLDRLQSRG